jgi:hypothetical protein
MVVPVTVPGLVSLEAGKLTVLLLVSPWEVRAELQEREIHPPGQFRHSLMLQTFKVVILVWQCWCVLKQGCT